MKRNVILFLIVIISIGAGILWRQNLDQEKRISLLVDSIEEKNKQIDKLMNESRQLEYSFKNLCKYNLKENIFDPNPPSDHL